MGRVLCALIFCIMVSGCGVRPVFSVSEPERIRSVALITAVRDTVTFSYGREHQEFPVDWGIRARVSERYTESLAKYYQIKALDRDITNEIIAVNNGNRYDILPQDDHLIPSTVKKYISPGQADAIVVVYDRLGACYVLGEPKFPYYIGFIYKVYVLDGNNFEMIGKELGLVYRDRPIFPYDQPAIDINLGWRGEPFEALPPRIQDTIRRGVYQLIDRSAPFTLRRLELIPKPSTGSAE